MDPQPLRAWALSLSITVIVLTLAWSVLIVWAFDRFDKRR